MKAHELIDRLATLDEASTVEEPTVDPGILPKEPARDPGRENPRRTSNPFEIPPDFEPGQLPAPKSEDQSGEIAAWLEATQQPIQDWDWNGSELRLLMDDGSTEVYTRQQLEQSGVFDREMAFAESEEDEAETFYPEKEGPDEETVEAAIADETPPSSEAAGVLDMILGREQSSSCAGNDDLMGSEEPQVIEIEGEGAEKLTQAVSDVVQAILGIVGADGEEAPDADTSQDKDEDKKEDKPKKDKEKGADKDKDKKADKKDDKDDE